MPKLYNYNYSKKKHSKKRKHSSKKTKTRNRNRTRIRNNVKRDFHISKKVLSRFSRLLDKIVPNHDYMY